MIAPINADALAALMSVPIQHFDLTGIEFALGIVFSVPIALVLGLLTSLAALGRSPVAIFSAEHRRWRRDWHRRRAGWGHGFVGDLGCLGEPGAR